MNKISLIVNGRQRNVEIEGRTLLVDLLRGHLGLTGTHVGCDTSQCGACVVRLNGDTVKSCSVLAATLPSSSEITTIEAIAAADGLHPMQRAFSECHGLQCGFCTPGLIITAIDIAERNPQGLSAEIVRKEIKGNLCRCTGYQNIVAAVLNGAADMGFPASIEAENA